jgi:LysR family glycine cleavage system transcriptional activator
MREKVTSSPLPPLNAMRAFEAAARRGSFVAAANDLHVTHWAIGKQIRLLEDWLGVRIAAFCLCLNGERAA